MNFLTAVHTDIGITKKTNQDSALIMQAETGIGNVLLAVVCDGMGGLAKGEVASSAVIRVFSRWFEEELPYILALEDPKDRIFSSWEKIAFSCNDKIAKYGKSFNVSMGTTVVAMLFAGGRYYIMNIGDSRAYCISDRVNQLTKDQTFIQREMDMGRMTYEEAMNSPQRNVLLQCVGASSFIDPDFLSGEFSANQVFLLCSDGFRHVISEEEIYGSFNSNALPDENTMKQNAFGMTELVKSRHERDNITAVLVKTI